MDGDKKTNVNEIAGKPVIMLPDIRYPLIGMNSPRHGALYAIDVDANSAEGVQVLKTLQARGYKPVIEPRSSLGQGRYSVINLTGEDVKKCSDESLSLSELGETGPLPVPQPKYTGTATRPAEHIATFDSPGLNGGHYGGVQQDRVLADTINLQTGEQALQALRAAYEATDKVTRSFKDDGSTATVAIITPDNYLTVAQTGDSPILVFVENTSDGSVKFYNLTRDHTPAGQRARINAAGGGVFNGRVNGILKVGRAFGDSDIGPALTSEPEMQSHNLTAGMQQEGCRFYVAVASDGLLDDAPLNRIAAEIKAGRSLAEIVEAMTASAAQATEDKGYPDSDNISIVLTEVKPGRSPATLIGVMDGHGNAGDTVAEIVKNQIWSEVRQFANNLEQKSGLQKEWAGGQSSPLSAPNDPKPSGPALSPLITHDLTKPR